MLREFSDQIDGSFPSKVALEQQPQGTSARTLAIAVSLGVALLLLAFVTPST